MRRRLLLLVAAALLTACGGEAPIATADLHLRVTADAEDAEFGRAVPVTVVRTWRRDLVPSPWDDGSLAPLVVRLEAVTQRENDSHVEETRRYRGYAFTLRDVTVAPLRLVARPEGGGAARVVEAPPLRLRVRGTLDPAAPGAPELPGALSRPSPPRLTWAIVLAAGLAVIAWGLVRVRRRGGAPVETALAEPEAMAHERALERLRAIRDRGAASEAGIVRDFVACADLVRDYVGERWQLRARHLTSEELLAAAPVRGALPPSLHGVLADVLARGDRVKFAAHRPVAADRTTLLDAAEVLVQETGREAP